MPEWAAIVSFVIGIVAFVISVLAFLSQLRDAKRQNAKMELLAGEMSTHYIGTFPKHLVDIIELADHAHGKLCIMADCVDYGSFSAPDIHQRSLEAIVKCVKAERRVKVQIILYDDPMPISRSSPFYGKTFEQLKDNPQFTECLNRYLTSHHQAKRPTNDEEFRRMLLEAHERFQYELLDAGVDIHKLSMEEQGQQEIAVTFLAKPAVFFWVEDDEAAVFLFALATEKTRGLAFRTRDAALLKIFESTFDECWKQSHPIQGGKLQGPETPSRS